MTSPQTTEGKGDKAWLSGNTKPAEMRDHICAVHQQHPDWGGGDIADFLQCTPSYVYAVARRYDLRLPKQKAHSGRLRKTERNAALMDLGFLRKAIDEDDDVESLLNRIDDLTARLRKQEF